MVLSVVGLPAFSVPAELPPTEPWPALVDVENPWLLSTPSGSPYQTPQGPMETPAPNDGCLGGPLVHEPAPSAEPLFEMAGCSDPLPAQLAGRGTPEELAAGTDSAMFIAVEPAHSAVVGLAFSSELSFVVHDVPPPEVNSSPPNARSLFVAFPSPIETVLLDRGEWSEDLVNPDGAPVLFSLSENAGDIRGLTFLGEDAIRHRPGTPDSAWTIHVSVVAPPFADPPSTSETGGVSTGLVVDGARVAQWQAVFCDSAAADLVSDVLPPIDLDPVMITSAEIHRSLASDSASCGADSSPDTGWESGLTFHHVGPDSDELVDQFHASRWDGSVEGGFVELDVAITSSTLSSDPIDELSARAEQDDSQRSGSARILGRDPIAGEAFREGGSLVGEHDGWADQVFVGAEEPEHETGYSDGGHFSEEGGMVELLAAADLSTAACDVSVATPGTGSGRMAGGAHAIPIDHQVGLHQAFELAAAPIFGIDGTYPLLVETVGAEGETETASLTSAVHVPADAAGTEEPCSSEEPNSHKAALPTIVVASVLGALSLRAREATVEQGSYCDRTASSARLGG